MRRLLTLLCAATADAAWYVIGEKPSNSRYSQADAECMFKGKKIAFLGDSNMRYHYFAFNNFLEKGMLIQSYNKKGSPSAGTHDSYEIWTRAYGRSPDGTHLQAMSKKFYAETSYWFIQTTWFADDTGKPMDGHKPNMQSLISELKNYDLVVVNSAWWDLKEWKESERGYVYCGDNWNGDCASSYKSDVTSVADQLMGATKSGGVWRSSSCCGDWKNGIKDVSSIENMNKIAEDVCKSKNCAFADVFDLYGVSDLKDNTVDGKHADRYNYHEWTLRVMEAAERQLKTGCIKGGGGGGGGGGGDAEDEEEEEEEDDELTPEKFCEDNGYKSKDYDKKRIAYDKVKCEEIVENNEADYAACCCEDKCDDAGGGGGDGGDEDEEQCADVGEQCKDEGDCCDAPPRACFLKKGSSKGKCFDECPDDKAYECYEEEEKCKGTGKDCGDDDECCDGRSCFAKTDGDGTCEKECPDDDKYECYEAPCKGTGGKCSGDDDCCSGRSCFPIKGKDGTCEKQCPDDKDYDCYEEPCADKGDRCGDDEDCCDANKCFERKDGKGTCEAKCPDDKDYECYEEPCKGTGGCSKDADCCDGRDCFPTKKGGGTCEKSCPDDSDYECYVEPCTDEGDRCSKDDECCDSTKCFERKDGKATCEKTCPDDKDYECYEEPCKGTGGGCSKDSECCDGRDCFERKNGGGTCEKTCPDDEDYKCYVEPCASSGDRCSKKSDCCDGRDCYEMKNGKATCERECPNDSDYRCYVKPTRKPTLEPTKKPQADPTRMPTQKPQARPTKMPTRDPTREPTRKPTQEPTKRPVPRPTSPPESPCRNGRKDGDETDVDCGGGTCGPCEEGDKCRRDDDCEEPTDCINDRCRFRPSPRPTKEPTREPTRKPTDKPVANPNPTRPPTREPTRDPTRRPTDKPTARPVPRPTSPPESPCRNGVKDGDETDVDCGGSDCGPCERGERCKNGDDCEDPLACVDDRCVFPPTREPTREPTDRPVAPQPDDDDDDDDAPSDDGPACDNNERDGAETDIDCGGPTCNPCRLGRDCVIDGDCESGLCDGVCRRVVAPAPAPPPAPERKCPPRMELVPSDECPANPGGLPRCQSWAMDEMCLGDGTCGTDADAGNCFPKRRRLQDSESFAVYRALPGSGKSKKKGGSMPGYGVALLVLFLLSLACLCCCFVAYALRNPSRNRTDVKPRNLEPMKGRRGSKHRRRSHHGHLPRDYVDAPPPYKTEESLHFVEESKIEPQQSYVEAERRGRRAAERNPMMAERAVADLDEPYAEPRRPEPRYAEPRQAEPRRPEPRRPEPRYAEPRYAEPRRRPDLVEPQRSGVGDANYWRDRARAAGAGAGAGAAYYGRDDERRRTASPPQRAVAYRTESPQSAESPLARYTARTGGSSNYWRDRARAAGVAHRGSESLPRARSAPYLTAEPYRAAAPSPPRRDYRAESPPYRETAPRRSPSAHLDDLEPLSRPPPLGSPERRRPTPIIATRLPASPLLSPLTASPGVLPPTKRGPTFLVAIEDFRATRPGQVDLTPGDRVICLDDSDAVWWRGSCRGRVGLFPADAVEPQS